MATPTKRTPGNMHQNVALALTRWAPKYGLDGVPGVLALAHYHGALKPWLDAMQK